MSNDDALTYFKAQILPNSPRMFGVAAAITGSRDVAADAVQSAMLNIWDQVRSGNRPKNPLAYCLSAVRNLCLTASARAARVTSLEACDAISGSPPRSVGATAVMTAVNGAEESIALREVRAQLEHLPDKQRQAIELTAFAGCSPGDVAEALEVSEANARQLLSRGRSKLREWFRSNG